MESKSTLLQKLKELGASDMYPYHMPGHKRNGDIGEMAPFYGIDITEIDDFDNLHEAEGILRDIEHTAASFYGAKDAFISVNGTTAGILASIMSQTQKGDGIIMARGCHKSVYNGVYMHQLMPTYLVADEDLPYGIPGEITVKDVAYAMDENKDIKTVLLTSPTYEGLVLDVEAIAKEVHSRGGLLIVDAAHGAHLGISDRLPDNPVKQGADLVIVSLHKTMPAMTQTSLVLVGSDRVQIDRLKRYMSMLQTSSPSYVLMASIEQSLIWATQYGEAGMETMILACEELKESVAKSCRHLTIYDGKSQGKNWDAGKIVIAPKNGEITGKKLYQCLREDYHLQLEMAAPGYVLAMFTMADTAEAYERMEEALKSIDARLSKMETSSDTYDGTKLKLPKVRIPLWRAMDEETELVRLDQAAGRVAAQFVGLYPPGIPILVPGEEIGDTQVHYLNNCLQKNMHVQGIDDAGCLTVCRNDIS